MFLVGAAIKYNNMFPIEQSQQFVSKLHEHTGTGFTSEQFMELKEAMKKWHAPREEE